MNLFTTHSPIILTIVRAPQVIVPTIDDLAVVAHLPNVVFGVIHPWEASDPRPADPSKLEAYFELQGIPLAGPNVYRSAPSERRMVSSADDLYQIGRPTLLLIPKEPLYRKDLGSVAIAAQALAAREQSAGFGEDAAWWHLARAGRALIEGRITLDEPVSDGLAEELERRYVPPGRHHADELSPPQERELHALPALGRVVIDVQAWGHTLPNQPLALVYDRLPKDCDGKLRRGAEVLTPRALGRKLDQSVATPVVPDPGARD